MNSSSANPFSARICLLGFGEVGQRLADDLSAQNVAALSAWDIQFSDAMSAPSRALAGRNVRRALDPRDAVTAANVVVSAVTAAQDAPAAASVAAYLQTNTYFVDVNSVSPGAKKRVSEMVEANGARYIEAAIMSPIAPRGIASPILLGGTHAEHFLPIARTLGFVAAEVFSDKLGRASAAKMCRSVMIKGMEALLSESLISARYYGVEDTVLDSLRNLFPAEDWPALARYMISRSLLHGKRRAEEMREVAEAVREAGLTPWMSAACVERQDWAAERREAASCTELAAMLDRLRASLVQAEGSSC